MVRRAGRPSDTMILATSGPLFLAPGGRPGLRFATIGGVEALACGVAQFGTPACVGNTVGISALSCVGGADGIGALACVGGVDVAEGPLGVRGGFPALTGVLLASGTVATRRHGLLVYAVRS